jgi:hypothetical protein
VDSNAYGILQGFNYGFTKGKGATLDSLLTKIRGLIGGR